MKFEIVNASKKLYFDTEVLGLKVGEAEYEMGDNGILIYDKINENSGNEVTVQMSSDTSTLIPAFRILGWTYNQYFDQRDVVESQNDITFYWNKSKLAAYYNKFSTDELKYEQREEIIRKAVDYLLNSNNVFDLENELLNKLVEPCLLIGFYQGFPIFDSSRGLAKLQSRLGIHIDPESIMISSPLNRYESDVYELAENISKISGEEFTRKKNRVVFPKSPKLLEIFTK